MKYSEAINNLIHHVKRLTTENNTQNFLKSLSSEPREKKFQHHRQHNIKRLKEKKNIYIDWLELRIISMNKKNNYEKKGMKTELI